MPVGPMKKLRNPEKTIPPEAFDVMQYFYRKAHDPLIRCILRLSGRLDENALVRAVTLSTSAIPLLQCCFDGTARRPRWRDKDFEGKDMVHVVEAEADKEVAEERLLASTIDIAREPQLKVFILRKGESDTVYLIINHMVCDGAGFKEYLYLLCRLYNECRNNENYVPDLTCRSRGAGQVLSAFSTLDRLKILFSKHNLSVAKNEAVPHMEGDGRHPLFATADMTSEELSAVRTFAKSRGATVNDMILTAYARVLQKETKSVRVLIPCPIDLRRYLPAMGNHGICNLTSNLVCDLNMGEAEPFESTLARVAGQMRSQKSNGGCLKPVMMFHLAFHALSFRALQKLFEGTFTIPVVSFTNFGTLDSTLLRLDGVDLIGAHLTGAVKHVPYFQVAVSTYDDRCTLSCNLHGTPRDRAAIERYLTDIKKELIIRSAPKTG